MEEQKFQVVEPSWWKGYTTSPWRIPVFETEQDGEDFFCGGNSSYLDIGTTFAVIETSSGDMTRIRTSTGTQGWIKSHVLVECPLFSEE